MKNYVLTGQNSADPSVDRFTVTSPKGRSCGLLSIPIEDAQEFFNHWHGIVVDVQGKRRDYAKEQEDNKKVQEDQQKELTKKLDAILDLTWDIKFSL